VPVGDQGTLLALPGPPAQRSRASNHLRIDLYADDPDTEAARLGEHGARRIRRQREGDVWWWVLEDPEGNDFCVIASHGPDRDV
jgi:predicted enzyme related to lactoylglutathione lyase